MQQLNKSPNLNPITPTQSLVKQENHTKLVSWCISNAHAYTEIWLEWTPKSILMQLCSN